MPQINPYEAPQESGTTSVYSEGKQGGSEVSFKRILFVTAFVLQFVLMGLCYWWNGRIPGFSPFAMMGLGSIIVGINLSIFIASVVRRSWNLAVVQLFILFMYLFGIAPLT